MLVVTSFVGNPSVIPFHILSLLPGLGRTLVMFYIILSLLSLGLTKRIVNIFVEFVSLGDPSRRMFDDGA
jgi:hypothetical protein